MKPDELRELMRLARQFSDTYDEIDDDAWTFVLAVEDRVKELGE